MARKRRGVLGTILILSIISLAAFGGWTLWKMSKASDQVRSVARSIEKAEKAVGKAVTKENAENAARKVKETYRKAKRRLKIYRKHYDKAQKEIDKEESGSLMPAIGKKGLVWQTRKNWLDPEDFDGKPQGAR